MQQVKDFVIKQI